MNRVGIVACGFTKFSQDNTSIESILIDATKSMLLDCPEFSKNDIDVILVSTNNDSKYLGAILGQSLGITPKTAFTLEHLCSSGTNGIISAYSYIASNLADAVVVVGADLHDNNGTTLFWDKTRNQYTHPIFWASLFTHAYKQRFQITNRQLAHIPAKNHTQALDNPYAQQTKSYTVQNVLNSKYVTDDLRILDCSRSCTGGCCVLLVSERIAHNFKHPPVWITGIGQQTHSAEFGMVDVKKPQSLAFATDSAFKMSKRQPHDIDVIELHDAFSVFEPLILDGLGITPPGAGVQYCMDLFSSGDKKINPRGGILGAGHPLGCTGISQTAEIVLQLQNRSRQRQVDDPNIGLVHNTSAAMTSTSILVLEK